MSKLLAVLLVLISHGAWATNIELKCEAAYNTEKVLDSKVILNSTDTNKKFGSFQEYDFLLSVAEGNIIELQVYNFQGPSRTYAMADMGQSSRVALVIWNRNVMLDVHCTRI